MLIWRILCDGENPFTFCLGISSLEEMEKSKEDENFVNVVLSSLQKIMADVSVSETLGVRGAIESTLQAASENRTLATAMSFLYTVAPSHVES